MMRTLHFGQIVVFPFQVPEGASFFLGTVLSWVLVAFSGLEFIQCHYKRAYECLLRAMLDSVCLFQTIAVLAFVIELA